MEGIVGKILAGLVSLTTLLFTNFTGNDPQFRSPQLRRSGGYLILNTALENAFDNDFEDVFKCGKEINVWFRINALIGNRRVYHRTFRHCVSYDAMNAIWQIYYSENQTSQTTISYTQLQNIISTVELSIPLETEWSVLTLQLEAWLPEVEFIPADGKFNLMVLWKYRRPTSRVSVNLKSTA